MNTWRNKCFLLALLLFSFSFFACKVANGLTNALMPDISEDVKMGQQTASEISSKPSQFPLLPERGNEEVYSYVRGITSKILNSGNVEHAKDFPWEVKIINDPKTLNAFCTPGGYIYVYTGLIKYLDTEDQLAGVMGHEIAHADKRHSMKQLYQSYGVQILAAIGASVATQGKSASTQKAAMDAAQIASAVVGLKFSREHETEADNMSVKLEVRKDNGCTKSRAFQKPTIKRKFLKNSVLSLSYLVSIKKCPKSSCSTTVIKPAEIHVIPYFYIKFKTF